jgi:integrase
MPRDRTGITKTPYGYLVRVHVRPFPMVSKRFPPKTPFETLEAWRETQQRKLRRAKPAPGLKGTLEADVARYLAEWGATCHPNTVEQRTRHLQLWADAFPRRLRLTITTAEIRAQLAEWERHGLPVGERAQQRKRGVTHLAPATVNKVRQSLYQLYAHLDAGTGLENPVAAVPTRKPPELEPRGLDPVLVRQALAQLPRSKTKARLIVMAFTGLRPEEVRRIERRDWSPRAPRQMFVRTAKGGMRVVHPLTRSGAAAMRYFASREAFGGFSDAPLARMWKAAVHAVAPDVDSSPYDLRHTYGTELYRATRDIKATQAGLRQKSVSMTMRYVQAAVAPVLASGTRALEQAQRLQLSEARRRARADHQR